MLKEPVEFESKGDKIRGLLYVAEGQGPLPIVVLVSGFPPSGGDSPLAQALARRSIHTLTFDFRGTLKSEGLFTLRNTQEDIAAAIAYLQREDVLRQYEIDADRIILGGISFGGGMVMAYAARHPEISRIFALAGDDHGEFTRQYKRNPDYAAMIDALFEGLWASSDTIRLGNRKLMKELLDDPRPYDSRLNAPALVERDILLVGGWDDRTVTIEDKILPLYRALKAAGAQHVQIAAVQDDHSFEKCDQEVVELVVHWLNSSEPI